MATHDIEFAAKYVDQCMMLFDGAVIMNDAPKEFFSGNFFLYNLYQSIYSKRIAICINVGGCVRSVSKRYVAFIICIFCSDDRYITFYYTYHGRLLHVK